MGMLEYIYDPEVLLGKARTMHNSKGKLFELLEIGPRDLVSFTGAGGKTSLIFHLCRELVCSQSQVIVTTTTRMHYPENFNGGLIFDANPLRALRAIESVPYNEAFIAAGRAPEGKVKGYTALQLDQLRHEAGDRIVLNEADGAKMKPYKFYKSHEPVIPAATTLVVHIMGAEIFGLPITQQTFHRCPKEMEGVLFDENVLDAHLDWFCRIKLGEQEYRRVLVVNKADNGREDAAMRMAEVGQEYFDDCVVTSLKLQKWGRPDLS